MKEYRLYGLNIKSEIELDQLMPLKEKAKDYINIKYGDIPNYIEEEIKKGSTIKVSKEVVWFNIREIATFYITNGKDIVVRKYKDADMTLLRIYLTCSCMGFIMLQRDMVAIHGGVIVMNDDAVIVTGDRGAGKSTLTTALRKKGYPFLADDVASTFIDDGPMIYPGFPYQKLCEDAMESMGYNKKEHEYFYGDGKRKYVVQAVEDFINKEKRLKAIFNLRVGDVEKVIIEEIKGTEKLSIITRNIYRVEFIQAFGGMSSKYFKECLEIAKSIKAYRIIRPIKGFTTNEQIKLIEEKIF
ncbi:hypothetical protein [Clostridium sp.]|uniref:hypothetical protein n=1 Tax=Clostridium sp. TaxID=1506 RepID=UPI003F3B2013